MTHAAAEQELIALTHQLLESISASDWETYTQLCDPTLSAFEPEARGHLVEGLPFHHFYFQREAKAAVNTAANTTIASPHVRMLGDDAAIISYVRLVQFWAEDGAARTAVYDETRVWRRAEGSWRHVHFHRSSNASEGL